MSATRSLIDIEAVALELGTSIRHIRGLVAQRRIPHLKVGHFVRFDPAELDDWLASNRVEEVAS